MMSSDGVVTAVSEIGKSFGRGLSRRQVLHDVSFDLAAGASLGLVGESGSGKSTIAKILAGIYGFDAGEVRIGATTLGPHDRRGRAESRVIRFIPQNPYASFDPRRTIGHSMAEALSPVRVSVRHHRERIAHWLERVGLPAESIEKYPHEFSGGQRQRVAIARVLSTEPQIVVADEITSALDMSVQSQVLELLDDIRAETPFAMLFISHNLAVVRKVCDEVMVMRGGAIVERGATEQVFTAPEHPYTCQLLDSIPGAPGFSLTS